jgi:hypothetical protein
LANKKPQRGGKENMRYTPRYYCERAKKAKVLRDYNNFLSTNHALNQNILSQINNTHCEKKRGKVYEELAQIDDVSHPIDVLGYLSTKLNY